MNAAHLHLVLNTVPPIIATIAIVLLALGVICRREHLMRTGMSLLLCAALLAIPVYLAGKAAVMVVRNQAGVALLSIGDHHVAATRALVSLETAGALALAALFRHRRRPLSRTWAVCVLLTGILATGLLMRTAYIGGHIRHPETRPGFDPESGAASVGASRAAGQLQLLSVARHRVSDRSAVRGRQ